jgi:dihydrofolate reductase
MRRIHMFNRVSADGYFAAADGSLSWVVPDEEVEKEGAAGIPQTDTVLFGRKTYEMFASFWPRALEDASTPDPHGGGPSSQQDAFARGLTEMTKIVFSRTLQEVTWKGSRIVRELDPRAIEAMKRQPGKDMILFGSGSIVSALTRHGLIDDYTVVVAPVLLGSGRSWLDGLAEPARLELVEEKRYRSGNVKLHYVRR